MNETLSFIRQHIDFGHQDVTISWAVISILLIGYIIYSKIPTKRK